MANTSSKPDMTNVAVVLGTFMPDGGNDYCPKLIASSVRSIGSAGKKLDARVHATAYAILVRSLAPATALTPATDLSGHLDCSMVGPLLNAMPKGGRTNALVAWFRKYSNIRPIMGKDKSWTAKLAKPGTDGFIAPKPQAAYDNPFWTEVTVEGKPLAFDDKALTAMIEAICKKAAQVEQEGGLALSADNVIHLEAIRAMRKAA